METTIKTATLLAVCLIFLLALSACGQAKKVKAKFTGSSSACIGGVEYLQFPSGATVAYNRDGSIKLCD